MTDCKTPEDRFADLTREKMAYGHKSDIEVATMVRMLLRSDLDHEPVCAAARDRIMFLHWELRRMVESVAGLGEPRPLKEWTEEDGDVLWWFFPLSEGPYVGTPLDLGQTVEVVFRTQQGEETHRHDVGGWPGYHTHWTPLPPVRAPDARPATCRNRLQEEGKPHPKSGCEVTGCAGVFGALCDPPGPAS